MYKKIKNGSFMNWIWFIICILPLCFILFSLNNEDNKTQVYNNLFSLTDNNSNVYLNDYDISEGDIENNYINNSIIIDNDENPNYTVFLTFEQKESINYWYYLIVQLPYKVSVLDLELNYQVGNVNNEVYNIAIDSYNYNDYYIFAFEYNFELNNQNMISLTMKLNFEVNEFYNNDYSVNFGFFVNDNYIEKEYFEGFPHEIIIQPLNYWFNNFKSNGFISSAFLNLSTLFGVNNVYYSLACYYIEYLLVIALLHLAFDVLYMLPNICHKFMEKIGGERD